MNFKQFMWSIYLFFIFYRDAGCKNHKFGLVYQAVGNTTERELFNNSDHSGRMEAFMSMLGTKIDLSKHTGYFGGLHNFEQEIEENGDEKRIKGGKYSLYTEHGGKGVMFHVSTLLPTRMDGTDVQQIEVGHYYILCRYTKISLHLNI